MRETRAHAREIKFLVDAARGPEIQVALTTQPVSKYRAGLALLGLSPDATQV